jgi:hypothetical protein
MARAYGFATYGSGSYGDAGQVVEQVQRDPYRRLILSQRPSLYWPLSELTGTVANDFSPNRRQGAYQSNVVLGAFPTAISTSDNLCPSFDGSGASSVESSFSAFTGDPPRTFTGWAWRDANAFDKALFGGGSDTTAPSLRVEDTMDVRWNTDDSGGTTTIVTNAWPGEARWVHWAFAFWPNGFGFYALWIQGRPIATGFAAGTYPANPGFFVAGARGFGGFDSWDGRKAEVAIFDRILTDGEVLAQFKAGWAGSGQRAHDA